MLSDSLAFVGPRTPHPSDDARLWPNVMAAALDVEVEVFGDFGWTVRDAWYALGHNTRLWPVLRRADAVVLALGSYDSAPEPLPTWLWKRIAMIRSSKVRRVVAAGHRRAIPKLTRLFSYLPGGGPVVLRPSLMAYFLQASLRILRQKRRGLPVLGMTPIVAKAQLYAGLHKGRPKAERTIREWAAAADVSLVDLPAVVGEHMLSGRCNPDGMHLGWEGHTALGLAVAARVAELLPGGATSEPSRNGFARQAGQVAAVQNEPEEHRSV